MKVNTLDINIIQIIEKQKRLITDITPMAVETITAKLWQEKVRDSVLLQQLILVQFVVVFVKLQNHYIIDCLNNMDKLIFLKIMVDDKNNHELIDRLSIEGTPTLKFYCKNRDWAT